MKVSLLLLACAAAIIASAEAATSNVVQTNNPTGLQIVTLRAGVDVDAFVAEFGIKPSRIYRHALNGFAAPVTPEITKRLNQDSRIRAIEPDGKVALCEQTVPTGVARMNIT